MSRPVATMMTLMAALMGGTRIDRDPETPMPGDRRRPDVPKRTRPGRKGASTNELVVCRSCGSQCEPGKGCGARANAIFLRWKKIDDYNFDCPACRQEAERGDKP